MRITTEDNPKEIQKYAHIKRAPISGPIQCHAKFPGRYCYCTRERGHSGPHISHGFLKVLAVWGDDDQILSDDYNSNQKHIENRSIQKTTDDLSVLVVQIIFFAFQLISSYFGFIQYRPIDSYKTFILLNSLGFVVMLINSIPINFEWDSSSHRFVNTITKESYSRARVLVSRSLMRGIGTGAICYALGDLVSRVWTLYQIIGMFVSGIVIIISILITINEPRKYQ